MTDSPTSQIVAPDVVARADEFAERFRTAQPFRHVVIEQFLRREVADELLANFPAFDVRRAINEDGEVGGKAVVERIREIAPVYAALDDVIQTRAFLDFVGRITGISNLRYDPYYFGGGTHENRHGQDLDAHIDFNRHPVERWHRRLNLIVYLNHDWQRAWGGNLELHSDPRSPDDRVTEIEPQFNRCVIFETTEHSWHAFSRIDLPESERDRSRKSVALYFYTDDRPAEETADTHSTVYVDRPLPAWFKPGHVLTEANVDEVATLYARRDHHLQRLYRDVTAAQKQIETLEHALSHGRLGRLRYWIRRLLARLGR